MADPTNDTIHDAHPDDGAFEAFVIGALEGDAALRFEAHLPGCAACAARLRAEAELEERLHEVRASMSSAANRSAPTVRRAPVRKLVISGIAAALAIAAALVLLPTRRPPQETSPPEPVATPRPPPIAPVVCEVLLEQAACIEGAHRRGLVVAYPPGAGPPSFGGAPTRGPSSSPFPIASRKEDQ